MKPKTEEILSSPISLPLTFLSLTSFFPLWENEKERKRKKWSRNRKKVVKNHKLNKNHDFFINWSHRHTFSSAIFFSSSLSLYFLLFVPLSLYSFLFLPLPCYRISPLEDESDENFKSNPITSFLPVDLWLKTDCNYFWWLDSWDLMILLLDSYPIQFFLFFPFLSLVLSPSLTDSLFGWKKSHYNIKWTVNWSGWKEEGKKGEKRKRKKERRNRKREREKEERLSLPTNWGHSIKLWPSDNIFLFRLWFIHSLMSFFKTSELISFIDSSEEKKPENERFLTSFFLLHLSFIFFYSFYELKKFLTGKNV